MSEIVRLLHLGQVVCGIREGDGLYELVGSVFGKLERGSFIAPYCEATLLPPCQPSKIVGIGRNYRPVDGPVANELGTDPIIFIKAPSAVIGPADPIILPENAGEVYFEAELAVVIKRQVRHVSPSAAMEHILGYTCANDVTARSAFAGRILGDQGKSHDTFCPLGPSLVTDLDVGDLMIRARINGQLRQESSTKDMILSIPLLIAHVSRLMTLEPGDVILTGTPPGADVILPGDMVEVEIEGIGKLANEVIAENSIK